MSVNWNDLSKYRNQLYGIFMLWIVVFHVWQAFSEQLTFEWTISYIIRFSYGVDCFLFLSGISMYFAIQKYLDDKGNIRIVDFYKKRVTKIFKVYVLFCVPFLVIVRLVLNHNISHFLQELFFVYKNVNSFWFLLCIVICYLIYPLLYKCMDKKRYIYTILIVYIVGIVCLQTYFSEFYFRFEILTSRIPIFVLGAILGEKVYKKEEVNPYVLVTAICFLFSRRLLFAVVTRLPVISNYTSIINRLYGGIIAICLAIVLVMLMKYIKNTQLFKLLGFMGTFTLETYVFHIVYRWFLLTYLHLPIDSYAEILAFLVLYTVTSFVFGYFLHLILRKIRWEK